MNKDIPFPVADDPTDVNLVCLFLYEKGSWSAARTGGCVAAPFVKRAAKSWVSRCLESTRPVALNSAESAPSHRLRNLFSRFRAYGVGY